MRRSMKPAELGEALQGPRLTAWLPEAEWEWSDRVRSNLWPCELVLKRMGVTAPAASPKVIRPEDER